MLPQLMQQTECSACTKDNRLPDNEQETARGKLFFHADLMIFKFGRGTAQNLQAPVDLQSVRRQRKTRLALSLWRMVVMPLAPRVLPQVRTIIYLQLDVSVREGRVAHVAAWPTEIASIPRYLVYSRFLHLHCKTPKVDAVVTSDCSCRVQPDLVSSVACVMVAKPSASSARQQACNNVCGTHILCVQWPILTIFFTRKKRAGTSLQVETSVLSHPTTGTPLRSSSTSVLRGVTRKKDAQSSCT